jgi:hypothetical protein
MLLRLVWALLGWLILTHASRIPNKGRIPNKIFRVQTGRISSWTYSKADVYRGTTVLLTLLTYLSSFSRTCQSSNWRQRQSCLGTYLSTTPWRQMGVEIKGKVVPVLNYLSTMPWRQMGVEIKGKVVPVLNYLSTMPWRQMGVEIKGKVVPVLH